MSFHERQLGDRRCLESGVGEPLVWLHEPGRLTTSEAHERLAAHFRVLAVEDMPDLEAALADAGIEKFQVLGGDGALRVALRVPERVTAAVAIAPQTLQPELATLDVPTLVLFGTRGPNNGASYRALMPDCYFVLVYKAGADVAADRPDAFAALVADFLERREAFVVSNQPEKLYS